MLLKYRTIWEYFYKCQFFDYLSENTAISLQRNTQNRIFDIVFQNEGLQQP